MTVISTDRDYGYNISAGGDGATLFGEHNPSYGKPKSDEVKKKIRDTIHKNKSHAGKNNGRYGKPVSEETRKRISDANRGRKASDEERMHKSIAMRRALNTPESKKKRELRKNDPKMRAIWAEMGRRKRKYTDEFIAKVRSEYVTDKDIPILAEKYNMPFKTCMEMVHHNGHFKNR